MSFIFWRLSCCYCCEVGDELRKIPGKVDILKGREITVEFDRPTALQIDGETILGVTSYTARAADCPNNSFRAYAAASKI